MTLRIAIFGAGAIGSHLAWRLAHAGAQVGVIARGRRLDDIRADGIRIEASGQMSSIAVPAEEDAARLGPQDVVVMTVKDRDLASVAAGLPGLLGPDTAIVAVQNGIPWWYRGERMGRGRIDIASRRSVAPMLEEAIGRRPILGAVVSSPATLLATGVVHIEGTTHRIQVGAASVGRGADVALALAGLWSDAGMSADASADIREQVWEKLARNVCTGLIALLTNRSPAEAMLDPVLHAMSCTLADEVAAIATDYGYPLEATGPAFDNARRLGHVPSLVQDFRAGRLPDIASQFLAPLEMARNAGVAVPELERLVALATGLIGARN